MKASGSAVKGNGFDPKQAAIWQGQYDKLAIDKQNLHMKYMQDCAEVKQLQDEVLDRAKDAGIPKYCIKDAAKIKDWEAKIEAKKVKDEPEDSETLEQWMHALGMLADTPLGQAATAQKGAGLPGSEATTSQH